MQALEWSNVPQHLTCKVCGTVGTGTRVAVINSGGQENLAAVRCPACDSIDLVDEAQEASRTDAHVDEHVEVGAGIWAIADNLNRIDPATVSRFLDVGCDFGFAVDLAEFLFGWTAIGVEPSRSGRQGAEALGVDIRTEYLTPDTDLGEPFDLILASEVLEHVPVPATFLAAVAKNLAEDGTLLLTTPAAEVVVRHSGEAAVLSALSPGNHTFLASAPALEDMLRQAGFAAVSVVRDGGTLRATASRSQLPAPPDKPPVTPDDFLRYLKARAASAQPGSALAVGASVRAVREQVASGRLADAERDAGAMVAAIEARHGVDLSDPDRISATDDGELLPWCAAGASYALGFLDLQLRDNPARAAQYFDLATRLAQEWAERRDIVDLDTADLMFQAAYHRAFAMTRYAPSEAADAAMRLEEFIDPASPADAARLDAKRCRLLVELVARGHFESLGALLVYLEVAAIQTARDLTDEYRVAGLDALYSIGIAKSARGETVAAQAAWLDCMCLCDARPSSDAHAGQLAQLCRAQLPPVPVPPVRRGWRKSRLRRPEVTTTGWTRTGATRGGSTSTAGRTWSRCQFGRCASRRTTSPWWPLDTTDQISWRSGQPTPRRGTAASAPTCHPAARPS